MLALQSLFFTCALLVFFLGGLAADMSSEGPSVCSTPPPPAGLVLADGTSSSTCAGPLEESLMGALGIMTKALAALNSSP